MKKKLQIIALIFLIFFSFQSNSYSQWFKLPDLPDSGKVWDMQFVNSNTGWISLINPSKFIKTTDGGMNWILHYNLNIGNFQFIDTLLGYGIGWIGTNYTILKTTDGGSNWNNLFISGNAYTDLFFVNKDTGWVCGFDGFYGKIWRTNDGANNWFLQYTAASNGLDRIFFLKNKVNGEYWGWTMKSGGLWRTTNSGVNWNLINNDIGGGCQGGYDIYFIDTAKGIVTNDIECFSLTTNSGFNWTHVTERHSVDSKIGVGNNNIFWITLGDSIIKTINSFQTYGKQGTPAIANHIFAVDTSIVYAGSNQTNMMKTTNGGGPIIYSGIDSTKLILPEYYKLYQNYPNPFNPITKISYELPKDSKVSLIIYDVLGKEIRRLVDNEFKQAGIYSIDFNEPSLSSGVYFYRLIALDSFGKTGYNKVKSMVYIK